MPTANSQQPILFIRFQNGLMGSSPPGLRVANPRERDGISLLAQVANLRQQDSKPAFFMVFVSIVLFNLADVFLVAG